MKYFLSFQKSLKKQNLTFQNQWTSSNPREFGKRFSKKPIQNAGCQFGNNGRIFRFKIRKLFKDKNSS